MTDRCALIVGIDYYETMDTLFGCVNDALSVDRVLEYDGYPPRRNFECTPMLARHKESAITMMELRGQVEKLFQFDGEAVLFYFAGHGHIDATGGFLYASDSGVSNHGLALSEVLTFAEHCKARNKIIVLDSCYAGAAGANAGKPNVSQISEGTTILTACTATQYATEVNGSGVFTELFVDALSGGAADLLGRITPGAVYAHIDQSLGKLDHRPVFKTNVKSFFSMRQMPPKISEGDLRMITQLFGRADSKFQLDPTYEPEIKGRDKGMPEPIAAHTEKFAVLQKYNRNGLVVPVEVKHMWNAAMESKPCELTTLGRHYHRLVADKRV